MFTLMKGDDQILTLIRTWLLTAFRFHLCCAALGTLKSSRSIWHWRKSHWNKSAFILLHVASPMFLNTQFVKSVCVYEYDSMSVIVDLGKPCVIALAWIGSVWAGVGCSFWTLLSKRSLNRSFVSGSESLWFFSYSDHNKWLQRVHIGGPR